GCLQHVTGRGRGDEFDLRPGRHRHRAVAVARVGECGVGKQEHVAAVRDAVPVDHVGADPHPNPGAPAAAFGDMHAERVRDPVAGAHPGHAVTPTATRSAAGGTTTSCRSGRTRSCQASVVTDTTTMANPSHCVQVSLTPSSPTPMTAAVTGKAS